MDPTLLSNGAQFVLAIIELFLKMRPRPKVDQAAAVRELRQVFQMFVAVQRDNTELIEKMSWRILEQSQAMRANTEAIQELTRVLREYLNSSHHGPFAA